MRKLCILLLTGLLVTAGFGQTCPTIGQIYDYAVGDTFEISTSSSSFGGGSNSEYGRIDLDIVLTRQSFPDSIIYTIADWSCDQYGVIGSEAVMQLKILNIDAPAAPNYTGAFCETCDTIAYSYTCGTCSCTSSEQCAFGASSWSQTLQCGLGQTYLHVYCDFEEDPGDDISQNSEQRLIYYHKANGNVGGNFEPLVSAVSFLSIPGFKASLTPNPANTYSLLSVSELPGTPIYFKLFDAVGRLAIQKTPSLNSTSIDLQGQASGIYFWQVECNENILSRGRLVIQSH